MVWENGRRFGDSEELVLDKGVGKSGTGRLEWEDGSRLKEGVAHRLSHRHGKYLR